MKQPALYILVGMQAGGQQLPHSLINVLATLELWPQIKGVATPMPNVVAAVSKQHIISCAVFVYNLLPAYPGRALQGSPLSESKIQGKRVRSTQVSRY